MHKEFAAPLDGVSKIITGLCGPLFIFWPAVMLVALRNEPDKSYQWLLILVGVVLIAVFAACYILSPVKYVLNNETLTIVRKAGNVVLQKSNFKTATAIPKKEMGIVVRLLGNGGIFGYTGSFTSKTYGRMKWYVTHQDNLILIEQKDGTQFCISPQDVGGFIKALK